MADWSAVTAAAALSVYGVAAVYTEPSGDPQDVTVIEESTEELSPIGFDTRVSELRHIFSFDTTEVSLPVRGSTLVVGGSTYKVASGLLPGSDADLVRVACVRS